MIILLITFFSVLALVTFGTVLTMAKEQGHNPFTSSVIVTLMYFILGIAPLYFLYQENSLLWTILKFIGIFVLASVIGGLFFGNSTRAKLSLISIASGAISLLFILIYFLT